MRTSFPLCHDEIGARNNRGHCLTSFAFLERLEIASARMTNLTLRPQVLQDENRNISPRELTYRPVSANPHDPHARYLQISPRSCVPRCFKGQHCSGSVKSTHFLHGYHTILFPSPSKNFICPSSSSVN